MSFKTITSIASTIMDVCGTVKAVIGVVHDTAVQGGKAASLELERVVIGARKDNEVAKALASNLKQAVAEEVALAQKKAEVESLKRWTEVLDELAEARAEEASRSDPQTSDVWEIFMNIDENGQPTPTNKFYNSRAVERAEALKAAEELLQKLHRNDEGKSE